MQYYQILWFINEKKSILFTLFTIQRVKNLRTNNKKKIFWGKRGTIQIIHNKIFWGEKGTIQIIHKKLF